LSKAEGEILSEKPNKDRIKSALHYICIGMRQLTFAVAEGNETAMRALKKISEAISILGGEES